MMSATISVPRSLLVARPSVLIVYMALASIDGDAGGVRLTSYGELGAISGLSRKTAARAIACLAAAGYVRKGIRGQRGIQITILPDPAAPAPEEGGVPESVLSEISDNPLPFSDLQNDGSKIVLSEIAPVRKAEDKEKESSKEKEKEEEKRESSLSTGARADACARETNQEPVVRQSGMVPPPETWEEVRDAAEGQCILMSEKEARGFLDHYRSLGWRVNGGVILDWRGRLRKWHSCEAEYGGGTAGKGSRPGAMTLDRYAPGF